MEEAKECMQSPQHTATHELLVKYSRQALEGAMKAESPKIREKIKELFGEGGKFQSKGFFCLACAEAYAALLEKGDPSPEEIQIVQF